jgi:hypothetical protein
MSYLFGAKSAGLWFQQWLLFAAYTYGLFAGWSVPAVCGLFLWCAFTAALRAPSAFEHLEGYVGEWLLTVRLDDQRTEVKR